MLCGKFRFRDLCLCLGILALCFFASLFMQDVFQIPEQVTTTFAFGVFLISLLTDGYFWGLTAAFASVVLVNYAFTFPYFALNFLIPSNFYSAVVMTVIAVLTGALTTKVKHQEAVKAEAEMEKMRANLLRSVSHDLRTPLTTIYGSSSALRENSDSLTKEQKDKMLQGIQEDARWLTRMVENLLAVTRMDSGSVRLQMASTALDELIDSVLMKFRKHYPDTKVVLQLPEELVLIPMDAMLMQQVIVNLLENAVQHGKGLSRILLQVTLEQGKAVFEVSDDGCGISAERLPHLFSGVYIPPELPADNAKRNAGIGLSLCATIIRAHGGTIHAENAPEGGAVFRFTMNTEEMSDE